MNGKNSAVRVTCALIALPQSKPAASAHWEGSVTLPNRELAVSVDLAQNASGEWIGSLNLPAQNITDFPLSKIAVNDHAVTFAMNGIPGDPTFNGKLSADGNSLAGEFTQGGGTLPFQFKRISEAKVQLPPKSTPVDDKMLGAWEGMVTAGQTTLRIVITFSNAADGIANAVLDSPDQGVNGIAVTTVTQDGPKLNLDIKTLAATFTGELNKDETEIAGQLMQGGKTLALALKKAHKK